MDDARTGSSEISRTTVLSPPPAPLHADFVLTANPAVSSTIVANSVSRFGIEILILLATRWLPSAPLMMTLTQSGGIIQYMQSVQAYISPPIAAAFLLGLFFRRINSRGAIISLWTGFILGALRLIFEFMIQNGAIASGDNLLIDLLVGPNFLHFALYLFLFCSIVMIGVSMTAPQHSDEKLKGVTFDKTAEDFFEVRKIDVNYTIGLIALVLFIWYLFSPVGLA